MPIEIINWHCKRLPEDMDQPDKTLFLAPEFPQRHANLILHPLESDPREHVKPLSQALGLDAFILRGQLTGRGYMALKRDPSVEAIAGAVAELNRQGYRARLLRDNMFFRIPAPRRVSGVMPAPDGGLHFITAADAPPIAIPAGEPALAVIGDLAAPRQTARLREHDARPAPPAQDFSFHAIIDRLRTYYCDLYFPYQWTALRLVSDNFLFQYLGATVSQYAAENLATLLDRLAHGPLRLVWDDRYAETVAFGMRRQIEAAATAEKILTTTLREQLSDIEFNIYSRFRYILELASGFKCFT